MVTAELAAAFTALILVLTVAMSAVVAGIDLIRCTDAARLAARAAARGDDPAVVRGLVQTAAPEGAVLTVSGTEQVRVVVRVPVRGPLGALVPRDLEAREIGRAHV